MITARVRIIAQLGATHYPDFLIRGSQNYPVGEFVEVYVPPTEYKCLFGGSVYKLTAMSTALLGYPAELPCGLCQHELEIGD